MNDFCDLLGTPDAPVSKITSVKKTAKLHEIKNAWSERISTHYDLHSYVAALRDIFTLKLSQHEGMQNFNR